VGNVGYFSRSVFEEFCDKFDFFSDVRESGPFGGGGGGGVCVWGWRVGVCVFWGSVYGCGVIFVIA
jgi:hypothetical protein